MPATPNEPAADPARLGKLSLVLFSGTFDKVHYALAMAAAALAVNRPVTLFFTMAACKALLTEDGWHQLLPGENGLPPAEADAQLTAKGIGGFEELLLACIALGAQVMICEMGLRAVGLEGATLRADVPVQPGGLVTFLEDARGDGAALFI
jgi:peroxiredoxin family protein